MPVIHKECGEQQVTGGYEALHHTLECGEPGAVRINLTSSHHHGPWWTRGYERLCHSLSYHRPWWARGYERLCHSLPYHTDHGELGSMRDYVTLCHTTDHGELGSMRGYVTPCHTMAHGEQGIMRVSITFSHNMDCHEPEVMRGYAPLPLPSTPSPPPHHAMDCDKWVVMRGYATFHHTMDWKRGRGNERHETLCYTISSGEQRTMWQFNPWSYHGLWWAKDYEAMQPSVIPWTTVSTGLWGNATLGHTMDCGEQRIMRQCSPLSYHGLWWAKGYEAMQPSVIPWTVHVVSKGLGGNATLRHTMDCGEQRVVKKCNPWSYHGLWWAKDYEAIQPFIIPWLWWAKG